MTFHPSTIQNRTFRVGGFVRDMLLGRESRDVDFVVVGSTPAEMQECGFKQVGASFPVFLCPNGEEHALARTERKSGTGHTGFEVNASPDVTLEEDLQRRDLTINAMALAHDGSVVDPFGGQDDLAAGVLRHVSKAFADDPLRVLRVARFAARFGFTVAPETMTLMRQLTESGELDTLTPERVWMEMSKALSEDTPSLFFATLRECGALARVLPELDVLFGVPQPLDHHPEGDAGAHTMMVVDAAARLTSDPVVRFSAAMHDLGKGVTPSGLLPKHHGHEVAGVPLVHQLCDRLKVPAEFRQCATHTAELHGKAHRVMEMRPKKIVGLLNALDAFRKPENLRRFLTACEADARGRLSHEEDNYPQSKLLADAFDAATKVQGREVVSAGFKGVAVGEEMRRRRCMAVTTVLRRP